MKRLISCFKGEGSGTAAVQEPQLLVAQATLSVPGSGTANPERQDSILGCSISSSPLLHNGPVAIPWQAIVDGTLNFQETLKLGRGNFGELYRCNILSLNKVGAAKVTNEAHRTESTAEVTILHEADHPNVIKLLGQCYESTQHCALIYEFMPNGSLDRYLTDLRPGQPQATYVLNWEARMKIAVGVAKGLAYVHKTLKAVLRDIKPANIMLDQDFEPKLCDFGLAFKTVGEESKVTTRIGTMGYLAPETKNYNKVSIKSDVYSYGVLLLELFTGKKAYDCGRPTETSCIADWFSSVFNIADDEHRRVLPDIAVSKRLPVKAFTQVLDTAWLCLLQDPEVRPDMGDVENMIGLAQAYLMPEETIASSST